MEHFNDLTHAALRDTAATEDVGRVVGNLLGSSGGMRLEQTDRSAQVGGLLGVGHVAHLVGDGFQPGLVGLGERDHAGESIITKSVEWLHSCAIGEGGFSLLADDGLLNQLLVKDNALVAPLETLLDDSHGHAHNGGDHHESLVVKVAHDNDETLVLLAQQVTNGDLDVLKLHKGSGGSSRVGSLDLLGLDTLAAGNKKHREALISLAAGHEVVGEHAVGDPLPRDV